MHLGVAHQQFAVGIEDHGIVAPAAIGGASDDSADHAGPMFTGKVGQKTMRRPVRRFGDACRRAC